MDHVRWLTASYHFPALYSIRAPMSSPFAGKALPTPGPATVQKALLRASVERFGIDATRNAFFGEIVRRVPLLQPPEQIAISDQPVRVHKTDDSGNLIEGIGYREYVHAQGPMKIQMPVAQHLADMVTELFWSIGYWGQSHSFASCVDVVESQMPYREYAMPVDLMRGKFGLGNFFTAYIAEMDLSKCNWDTVVNGVTDAGSHLFHRLYVWPLIACEHLGEGRIWRSCSPL